MKNAAVKADINKKIAMFIAIVACVATAGVI